MAFSKESCPKKNQGPNPPRVSRPRRRPPPRGEQSLPALCSQLLNLFAFATGCRAKNYLQDSVCSLAHFIAYARPVGHTEKTTPGTSQSHRNAPREPPQQVGSVKTLAICLSHSPSDI